MGGVRPWNPILIPPLGLRFFSCNDALFHRHIVTLFVGRELEPDHNKKITKFVKVCMEKYVNQQARLAKEDVTHKVSSTARRFNIYIVLASFVKDLAFKSLLWSKPML